MCLHEVEDGLDEHVGIGPATLNPLPGELDLLWVHPVGLGTKVGKPLRTVPGKVDEPGEVTVDLVDVHVTDAGLLTLPGLVIQSALDEDLIEHGLLQVEAEWIFGLPRGGLEAITVGKEPGLIRANILTDLLPLPQFRLGDGISHHGPEDLVGWVIIVISPFLTFYPY